MFNLLIRNGEDAWEGSSVVFNRDRVIKECEGTVKEISEKYATLDENTIKELKSLPSLFVTENEATPSHLGYVIDIKLKQDSIDVYFEFDRVFPELPKGTIEHLATSLDIGSTGWGISRTFWAIKDVDLLDILLKKEFITQDQIEKSSKLRDKNKSATLKSIADSNTPNNSKVFIVHGRDDPTKNKITSFITGLGLEPIVLDMQANAGKTIIEKIEQYSDVGFAVVLYTPCDIGTHDINKEKGDLVFKRRARQNVVFEHGYLIAKLDRSKVAAVVKGDVEKPNDIDGIVYIGFDEQDNWKTELIKELKSAGYNVS